MSPEVIAGLLVRASIAEDESAPVLFGTSRIDHVRAIAAAAGEPPDESLRAFRSLRREVET
jgi:hypothetical protein